ncbi:MAG: Flp pilus assembly complex ATPase component TadA [Saccharofermentans sp.]|jgi:pilus assembly protein CpaF|nr:Flp pilus assembly complex ATPase component TadA [Saccharofermentans sp.]
MNKTADLDAIKEQLTYCVLNAIRNESDPTDDRLKEIIADVISSTESVKMPLAEKREMARRVFNSLRRMDVIEPLMQDPTITEIMVNGPDKIFYERGGKLYKSDIKFKDEETLKTVISCFFANRNRPLNEANPISDLRLPDGSRANAVLPPIASQTTVTIRKFTGISHDIVTLIRQGFISEEAARFLSNCVRNKKTIFLSGGTGSGKTTFLNSLSSFIPKDERVVTIEDSAELNLQGIDNLVRMEARLPGPDGSGEVNIGMMIRASLRMRPDRIIVGEVRGSESADMMNVLNTGHPGSMCTGHANSCFEMLERLTGMVMAGSNLPFDAIVTQLSMGIDIILHISRSREGKRYIDEICSVLPSEGHEYKLKTLYVNKGGKGLERVCSDKELNDVMAYKG